jgi:hypothetical protein
MPLFVVRNPRGNSAGDNSYGIEGAVVVAANAADALVVLAANPPLNVSQDLAAAPGWETTEFQSPDSLPGSLAPCFWFEGQVILPGERTRGG